MDKDYLIKYWNKKNIQIISVINDYENGATIKELEKNYNSSIDNISNTIKIFSKPRTRSESLRNYTKNRHNSLNNLSEDVIINMIKFGLTKQNIADIFNISTGAELFKNKINSVDYKTLRKEYTNINNTEKYVDATKISDRIWKMLLMCFDSKELRTEFGASSRIITAKREQIDNDMIRRRVSFINQNFKNNQKIGLWVYMAIIDDDIFNHLSKSFKDSNKSDFRYFFNSFNACGRIGMLNNRDSKTTEIEQNVINSIRTFYSGNMETHNRDILNGKEIDIFIPEFNIGIECSPSYTHSTIGGIRDIPNTYHMNKKQEASKNGVYLMTLNDFALSETYLKNVFPAILKNRMGIGNKYVPDNESITLKEIDKEVSKNIINEFSDSYRFGSNISSVISISDKNKKSFGYVVIGKNKRDPLNKSIRILDIISKFNLPEAWDIFEYIKLFVNNKYGTQNIFATTRRFYGSGKFLINNGFIKQENIRHRALFIKKDDFIPSANNKQEIINNGYREVFDCGQTLFKYVK